MSTALNIPLKRTKSFSKYIYSSNDNISDSYIFILEFECPKKKFNKKITKVISEKNSYLINENDKIPYKKYKKLNLEIFNLKNLDQCHKITINLESNNLVHKDNFIYLEIINNNSNLICYYNFENNQI